VRFRPLTAVGCLLLPWAAAGCQPELPNQYETEHLRISTVADGCNRSEITCFARQ
jgi:hypothetical protein